MADFAESTTQINQDWNLRLQYLAGLAPEGILGQALIEQITRQRPSFGPNVTATQE